MRHSVSRERFAPGLLTGWLASCLANQLVGVRLGKAGAKSVILAAPSDKQWQQPQRQFRSLLRLDGAAEPQPMLSVGCWQEKCQDAIGAFFSQLASG